MLINFKQLKRLPVETESGQRMGAISDVILDIDSHNVRQYEVKSGGLQRVFEKELLISPSQIISISKDKIIVMDGAYRQTADEKIESMRTQPHLQAQPITRK